MTALLVQVAIPSVWWKRAQSPVPEFALTVHEALDIERRLIKGVDLARERLRYIACCRSIESQARRRYKVVKTRGEFDALLAKSDLPATHLDSDYLTFINGWLESVQDVDAASRLSASFFPPDLLGIHRRTFETALRGTMKKVPDVVQRRLEFICWAEDAGCGVIEFGVLDASGITPTGISVETRAQRIDAPSIIVAPPPESPPQPAPSVRKSELEWMREAVTQGLASGTGVNFNNYHHPVITTVLHELAYRGVNGATQPLKVLYGDGSQADPFPVGGLQFDERKCREAEAAIPLRAALLSIRHPEMDSEVDFSWFPNRGASRSRDSYAETDRWCYQQSLELFSALPADDLTVIELYQTGLEPAVVGFYRALAKILRDGKLRVAVRPRIFRAEGVYPPGDWWV
jgi:hypothetical protein